MGTGGPWATSAGCSGWSSCCWWRWRSPSTGAGSRGARSAWRWRCRSRSRCSCCAGGRARTRWAGCPTGCESLIGYTQEGTAFVFGPLLAVGEENETIFALQVLPVIVFLGALIGLLFYLRVIQWVDLRRRRRARAGCCSVSRIESMFASTVIFLGQSEAPLMIAPWLRSLRKGQLFTIMVGGFTAAAGSTLVGYSLLGAPLEYLLAATVMNAPAVAADGQDHVAGQHAAGPGRRRRGRGRARRGGDRRPHDPRRGVAQRHRRARPGRPGRRPDRGHGRRAADRLHRLDLAGQRHPRRGRRLVRRRRPHLREAARLGAGAAGLAARRPVVGGGRGRVVDRAEDGAQRVRGVRRLRPARRLAVAGHGRRRDLRAGRLRQPRLDRDP